MLDAGNNSKSKRTGAPTPDFDTMMHDLKGVSAMLWFVASSEDLKSNGGSDFLHWLSHYLSDFHDDMLLAIAANDAKHGKAVPRG